MFTNQVVESANVALPTYPPAVYGSQDAPGQIVRTVIHGRHEAYVTRRGAAPRMAVEWFEPDAEGGNVDFQVDGLYSANEMVTIAESMAVGVPPNELPIGVTTTTTLSSTTTTTVSGAM